MDDRRRAARLDGCDRVAPRGIAAGQVYQDAVEAVATLEQEQRIAERRRIVPDVRGR